MINFDVKNNDFLKNWNKMAKFLIQKNQNKNNNYNIRIIIIL